MGINSPGAPAAIINSAQASAGGRKAPAASGKAASSNAGAMGKADMAGAMDGKPSGGLSAAVNHLKRLGS